MRRCSASNDSRTSADGREQVHEHDSTGRRAHPGHLGDRTLGLADVVQRCEAVHEVERPGDERERLRVALLQEHVRDPGLGEPGGAELEEIDGEVDPHHLADVGRDDLGRVGGAARDVEHEHLGVSGASWSTVPAGRRTNGESGPENRPTWRVNESRTTSSWSVMRTLLQSRAVVVPASPANDVAVPVAMRSGSPVRAGTWPEDADDLVTPWHTHELHQLLYAFEGVAEVESVGRPSSPPAPAGGVDPRRPPSRDHAAPRSGRSRCSSSRRWSTIAASACG